MYDDDFIEFAAVFDELIEPTVQATKTETIVGRALFHPNYKASLIGHDKVMPGHALPAKMVSDFMKQYSNEVAGNDNEVVPDLQSIELANDVRTLGFAAVNPLSSLQFLTKSDCLLYFDRWFDGHHMPQSIYYGGRNCKQRKKPKARQRTNARILSMLRT
jgi:hypothetical protein